MEAMEGDDKSPSPQQHEQQEISNTTPASTPSTAAISVSRVNVVPNSVSNGDVSSSPVVDVEAYRRSDGLGRGDCDHVDEDVETVKLQRRWRFFPGKNHFYCDGRVMTAPSIRFCLLSFALILLTFTLFIVFDAPFLTERLSVAVPILGSILFVSVIVNMVKTSFSDPGILPRASQQEADHLEKSYYSTNFRPPPRTKDIIVNGQVIKSKYCFTCKMFRPPRASHCGVCDNCVDRFDHHCPFLGNCIGKRNYRSFYAFIISLSFLAVFVLSASIAHLAMLSKERGNFLEALRDSPSSAIVIVISFFGMWTVIGLTGFHTYLIAVEQTTNEDIKGLFGRANAKNPFSHGNCCQNCCFVLCGPSQPSLIDPRGFATPDFLASLPRKTDPNGMLSPGKAPQLTPAKSSSNNCASDQLGQQGTFVGGTNKIYREQNSAAQSVQPVQHQPLQFSSPPSHASSAIEMSNGVVNKGSQPFPGLPAIPPEEKILLKGQTRNGGRGVVDYRQTVPESALEEIHSSQQEALISPSAASTVSLSTLSTSNMSSNNDYDTISSPPNAAGVTNSSSVRLHQPRNRNPNMTRRIFQGASASSEQLEGVVDPSDFDDDLDMPSLSNINDSEVIRRASQNVRGNNSNNGNKMNGNGLTKSTRSLPSTMAASRGVEDSSDINKIHVLETTYPNSSKSSVNSSSKPGIPPSASSSTVGIVNRKFANGGTRNVNNKRTLTSTMQNSPLHLDTIM